MEGWLFDAYPAAGGMRVWVLEPDGACRSFVDPWQPAFYAGASGARAALSLAQRSSHPVATAWTEKRELFSGETLPVLELRVPPLQRDALAARLRDLDVPLYGADIHLVQAYHYERGHFPLARCSFELNQGRLVSWALQDDPWALDYALPPLRTAHLSLSASEIAGALDPSHAPRGKLLLSMDGTTHELEGDEREQLESLARRIAEWDPDVLTTDWGDSFLLPRLDALSRDCGVALGIGNQ